MAKERIGLMGGSFNPIHERHLNIAACALEEARLNRVIFIPTGHPPHKHDSLADAEDRFEMTCLATLREPKFSASRIEIDREGVTYTADTLTQLHRQMPAAEFFFVIGEDTMLDLPHWHTPEKVFSLCTFLVCRRSTQNAYDHPVVHDLEVMGARFWYLSLPPEPVSATEIRAQLAQGETPQALPLPVQEYIRYRGLYGVTPTPTGAAEIYPKLKTVLSEKRFIHSLNVAATARELARLHGLNETQCEMAGLIHDCAKCMPLQTLQRIAREHRLLLDKETLSNANLLHGPVGAVLAETEYGIHDPNILSAVRCHTTGRIGMMPADMVLFLADKIEPGRRSYPALESVRELAKTNLVRATICSLRSTQIHVIQQKNTPHPSSQRVIDWLERLPTETIKERLP